MTNRPKFVLLPALLLLVLAMAPATAPQNATADLRLGLLKYNGGGDWYSNPTALPNLAAFCNDQLGTNFALDYGTVEIGSAELYNYPWVHMTGHGNVVFSALEAENLRNYLIGGGFLHIDDNYGMDPYVRIALEQVFPDQALVELPYNHPIYHQTFDFEKGLPKIHEHDGEPPVGYGVFYEDRLVVFYSRESDLGDGWEDESCLRAVGTVVSCRFKRQLTTDNQSYF